MNLRTPNRTHLVKKCLRWSLTSMAVSFVSEYNIKYKLYVCSFIFVLIPFTIICEIRTILAYENFDEKMYPILYIAAQTLISCVLLFLYANRDGLRQLYDHSVDNEYVDDEFFRCCDQWCRHNLTVFALVLTLMASYTFLPFAIAFGGHTELGSPLTFWYPATYPWRVDTLSRYAFTMIGQLFVAVPLTVTGFGFYLFIIQMRIIIRVHHRRLLEKIRALNMLWSQHSSHNNFKKVASSQLRSIVVYHQFLTK